MRDKRTRECDLTTLATWYECGNLLCNRWGSQHLTTKHPPTACVRRPLFWAAHHPAAHYIGLSQGSNSTSLMRLLPPLILTLHCDFLGGKGPTRQRSKEAEADALVAGRLRLTSNTFGQLSRPDENGKWNRNRRRNKRRNIKMTE